MPITKVNENELLDRLTDVFRTYGYEGASLSKMSEATGLQRASLYHRFPGGKEDMAKAVLERAEQWLATHVLAPLSAQGKPADRIRIMAKGIHEFYGGGHRSCLLEALSFGGGDDDVKRHIRRGLAAWVEALAKVAREAGVSTTKARQQAQDAIGRIQGSLVMARVLQDRGPFERTLLKLPTMILSH
ncbi:TetR/AcrR family transcriptional regulator [Nitrospira sp. M1]